VRKPPECGSPNNLKSPQGALTVGLKEPLLAYGRPTKN